MIKTSKEEIEVLTRIRHHIKERGCSQKKPPVAWAIITTGMALIVWIWFIAGIIRAS